MMLQLALRTLGFLMSVKARFSGRFAAQITHRRVIEISVDGGGAAHHFVLANRRVSNRPGRVSAPDVSLVFNNHWQALSTLLSPRLPDRLLHGLNDETIKLQGDGLLLLWFMGLAHQVYPVRRPPRLPQSPPDSYVSHTASESVSKRIPRLGVATEIDPTLTDALAARAKLRMMRGSAGEPLPPF